MVTKTIPGDLHVHLNDTAAAVSLILPISFGLSCLAGQETNCTSYWHVTAPHPIYTYLIHCSFIQFMLSRSTSTSAPTFVSSPFLALLSNPLLNCKWSLWFALLYNHYPQLLSPAPLAQHTGCPFTPGSTVTPMTTDKAQVPESNVNKRPCTLSVKSLFIPQVFTTFPFV